GPFDVNEGMKMSLGSTAKVRTLVHYLELMEGLHHEIAGLSPASRAAYAANARDPLTRWACETLAEKPSMPIDSFLTRAVERPYSASPWEQFFTGGGLHSFVNFDPNDNYRRLTIRDAAAHSTNLVFVRLMRDIVRYHEARLPYDTQKVLSGADSLTRKSMLNGIAEEESRAAILKSYREYHGLTPEETMEHLLGVRNRSPRRLAMLYFAWHPDADSGALRTWLDRYAGRDSMAQADKLTKMYGDSSLSLEDYAYLLDKHPLEIWSAGAMLRNPGLKREELIASGADARRQASEWLFRTRNRRAQDSRLRTRFERDAFFRMTPSWRRLGFPFDRLVPSYATAIGSSADRPTALAELMGIIVNDGEGQPCVRISRLVFGPATPYHTALESEPPPARRLLSHATASAARSVLTGVVESGSGTAHRLQHLFHDSNGTPIALGGKTGTGDNRFLTFGRGGRVISSQVVSRTAAFTFFIGDRYYGVVTASVFGKRAASYRFTSALPLRFLELLAPSIEKRWQAPPAQGTQLVLLQHQRKGPAPTIKQAAPIAQAAL
ncbi:MAG TPA: hypothetical protein VK527_10955, partial [Candidatus Limnocylindrales bacterium]|nr:hypothetical protein [Candidatus Limnocylindrales bacterium]